MSEANHILPEWFEEWTRPVYWEMIEHSVLSVLCKRNRTPWERKVMVRLPIACVVRINSTRYQTGPEFGIVCHYYYPDKVSVKRNPICNKRYMYVVEDLEVIGYWKGVDKEVMSVLFSPLSDSEVREKLSGLGGK